VERVQRGNARYCAFGASQAGGNLRLELDDDRVRPVLRGGGSIGCENSRQQKWAEQNYGPS